MQCMMAKSHEQLYHVRDFYLIFTSYSFSVRLKKFCWKL